MEQIFINWEKSNIHTCIVLYFEEGFPDWNFSYNPEKDESTYMSFTVFGLYQENEAVAETRGKSA